MPEVVEQTLRIAALAKPPGLRIAELAGLQHGVVATWQLELLGVSRHMTARLVRVGHLHRLRYGAYAVGHRRLTRAGGWMAAVLACGPEAMLSHRAAAALWGLRRGSPGTVDVTIPGRCRRARRGIRVHRSRQIEHGAIREGIPVTSLHRTLLDYAAVAERHELRLAFEAAERQELLELRILSTLLDANKGRRGVGALRELIAEQISPPDTRSSLERRFLELVRAASLPEPQVNVVVEGYVVDFFWPKERLIVEVDSYAYHRSRRSFEEDRGKDLKLQLAGNRVLRITDARIDRRPALVQRDLLSAVA